MSNRFSLGTWLSLVLVVYYLKNKTKPKVLIMCNKSCFYVLDYDVFDLTKVHMDISYKLQHATSLKMCLIKATNDAMQIEKK